MPQGVSYVQIIVLGPYIRKIMPGDMGIPLLGYQALSGWGEAVFLYLRGRETPGELRVHGVLGRSDSPGLAYVSVSE
jgi:hypothetical protein